MEICEHCKQPLREIKTWWGKETYYGLNQHTEYECEHCGSVVEIVRDVPSELLPFNVPEEIAYDE